MRSIGVPSWDDAGNVHYGLELSKQKGPHDGTRDGVAYFVCKPQHGIYIEAQEGGSGDTAKRKKKKSGITLQEALNQGASQGWKLIQVTDSSGGGMSSPRYEFFWETPD